MCYTIRVFFRILLKRGQKFSAKFVGRANTNPRGATSYITWGKLVPKGANQSQEGAKAPPGTPPEINPDFMLLNFYIDVVILLADDTDLLYSDLAAGAESGWDFSSRWLRSDSLSSIRTLGIIPVDLNAIVCQNEATLAKFYRIIGELCRSLLMHLLIA